MRISDWSSDVCSSDLLVEERDVFAVAKLEEKMHERHALAQARHDIGHQRHRQRKAQHVFVEPARLFGITAAIRRVVVALCGGCATCRSAVAVHGGCLVCHLIMSSNWTK